MRKISILFLILLCSSLYGVSFEVTKDELYEYGFTYGWRVANIWIERGKRFSSNEFKRKDFVAMGLRFEINHMQLWEDKYFKKEKTLKNAAINGIVCRIKNQPIPEFCNTFSKRKELVARFLALKEYRLLLTLIKE